MRTRLPSALRSTHLSDAAAAAAAIGVHAQQPPAAVHLQARWVGADACQAVELVTHGRRPVVLQQAPLHKTAAHGAEVHARQSKLSAGRYRHRSGISQALLCTAHRLTTMCC